MAKLKVPSLQHLARNWKPESSLISRDLVQLVKNPPKFTYRPIFSATQDLLQFSHPLEQVMRGIKRAEKREHVQKNFLELLPLIASHFRDIRPDFVNPVSTRLYSIGPGLTIPFTPPLVYGLSGHLYFPWFSFWRQNPLTGMKLRLFVTLVEEVLRDDPDLESATFQILDFSAAEPGAARSLLVQSTENIERLSHAEKMEMLEIFAAGFQRAKTILESQPDAAPPRARTEDDDYDDSLQPDLPF